MRRMRPLLAEAAATRLSIDDDDDDEEEAQVIRDVHIESIT